LIFKYFESNTIQLIMSEQNEATQSESGLKHGQFYVYQPTLDGKEIKVLINPLTQEDIADGWTLVLPRARKNSTIHHFSVYLSQLPPHLWHRLVVDHKSDSYKEITDDIYKYSVKMSKHDDEVRKLYSLIESKCPDLAEIRKQFKVLQNLRVKGWVMIRAHHIMYPSRE
jgi:hypothetical protein